MSSEKLNQGKTQIVWLSGNVDERHTRMSQSCERAMRCRFYTADMDKTKLSYFVMSVLAV